MYLLNPETEQAENSNIWLVHGFKTKKRILMSHRMQQFKSWQLTPAPGGLIKHFAQPLHRIQQHITLLYHGNLEWGTVGLDYPVHFVDGGVGDEVGEFAVDQFPCSEQKKRI
jgi:hypothetical protein